MIARQVLKQRIYAAPRSGGMSDMCANADRGMGQAAPSNILLRGCRFAWVSPTGTTDVTQASHIKVVGGRPC